MPVVSSGEKRVIRKEMTERLKGGEEMAGEEEEVIFSTGSPARQDRAALSALWGNEIWSQAATHCRLPFSYRALRQGCKAQGMTQSSGRTSNSDKSVLAL